LIKEKNNGREPIRKEWTQKLLCKQDILLFSVDRIPNLLLSASPENMEL